jgi:chorismate-pyruvate lyase
MFESLKQKPQSPTWKHALADLTDGWIKSLASDARLVEPAEMPEPFRKLLVHHEHMTTTLEAYHDAKLELEVLRQEREGDAYRRMILLKRVDTRVPVEFGIVRIHLQYIGAEVRAEIMAQERPLGEILIRHNVLRRIEPRWFVKIFLNPTLAPYFPISASECYGRLATIHYDGRPAIELLEVVSG